MSFALGPTGGLRFWTEAEIRRREHIVGDLAFAVRRALVGLNPSFAMERVETPVIMPIGEMSSAYEPGDFFTVRPGLGEDAEAALRAETTKGSYQMATQFLKAGTARLPLCVWQSGQSFRTERSDGATAEKLRFNAFHQAEFQCLYRADSKADYAKALLDALAPIVAFMTHAEVRLVPSDRLPSYSTETTDIEVKWRNGWKEVASCSRRTDFKHFNPQIEVACFEVAFGLDRLVAIQSDWLDGSI